ncbi:MurR/RpiR family transcriptional regulator [Microbacterium resistens]|uniref:hypothetical protein n=1 Tax=Microbacterium resistens TaxID=156977 RepID=UPI0022F0F213|nr:hypothetical protein [Streptomyces sp. MS2A]
MTQDQSHLTMIVEALDASPEIRPTGVDPVRDALFVGSGDSLSSALLAQAYGHRAASSGDTAFTGRFPAGVETVVGISHSGTSGATVQTLRLAAESGRRTVAVTSNGDSPLAETADEVQIVPSLGISETVPCAGHLMLALGVAAVCGEDTSGAGRALAARVSADAVLIETAVAALPAQAPSGIAILSLPDLRGAADFWMLKLIEATGVSVRTTALEESGHVDYFIGPQAHVAVQLIGAAGRARFDRLAQALEHTGQCVLPVRFTAAEDASTRDGLLAELSGAVIGTLVAEEAALRWGRPPFRGGAVNMDAAHIKLDGQAIA